MYLVYFQTDRRCLPKLTAIFIASLMKKTYLAVHLIYQCAVDRFENLLAGRKTVDSTPKYSLLAEDENQASIFSLSIKYK